MKIYVLCTLKPRLDCIKIINQEFPIRGLIGLSDKFSRGNVSGFVHLEKFCHMQRINFYEIDDYSLKKDGDIKKIQNLDIDLLLVLGWQRLIPDWLINQCKIGVIGVHGSAYGIENGRGRSPQNWALLMGKKKYYHSIFLIDKQADSGKIIDTEVFSLTDQDDIESSYLKDSLITAKLITKNLKNKRIIQKKGKSQKKQGFYLPQRLPEDGEIDWNRKTKDILNFIRGLSRPYPGAFSKKGNYKLTIWKARPFETKTKTESSINGEIFAVLENDCLIIKAKDGLILVDDYTLEPAKNIKSLKEGVVLHSADFNLQMKNIIERHKEKNPDRPLNKDILKFARLR